MENIFIIDDLIKATKDALLIGLDYIAKNCQYSVWTKKNNGWQEKWNRAHYSGLYATTSALQMLSAYPEHYKEVINNSILELDYMFDNSVCYEEAPGDDKFEKERKKRCLFLLSQNQNTTLKAVFYLNAYYDLKHKDMLNEDNEKIEKAVKLATDQIQQAYDCNKGYFLPARNNTEDTSVLTTMLAYVTMINNTNIQYMFNDELVHSRCLFIQFIQEYENARRNGFKDVNKFMRYELKRNVIAAIYAFSHTVNYLTKEKCLLQQVAFDTMIDAEIRNGFMIHDTYSVPSSTISYDVFSVDSKVIYIESILQLVKHNILPFAVIEYFIDDCIEIIDTVKTKKQYISWDMLLSFSHDIRGLLVLQVLLEVLHNKRMESKILKIDPAALTNTPRFINQKEIVLFMAYEKDYTQSFYDSVTELMGYLGFDVWCASDELYDQIVMDNIWNRIDRAQAVIIDCTGGSPNVMYEAGLSHGFGKLVLLCGEESAFPYENAEYFKSCIYNPDGSVNPPPYRDLQKGIIKFIRENINHFCVSLEAKAGILEKAREFMKYIE